MVGSTELKPWAIDTLPVHVDIGCARGRWVLALGEADSNLAKSVNHLGIEIRGALVDEANQVATSHGVDGHVQYLAIDMAQDACSRRRLLSRLGSSLAAVSVNFPDPYAARQRAGSERGVTLTRALALDLAEYLPAGFGVVYVASDKKHVAEDMVAMLGSLDGGAYFRRVGGGDESAAWALRRSLERVRAQTSTSNAGAGQGSEKVVHATTAGAAVAHGSSRAPPLVDTEEWLGRNVWGAPTEREVVIEQPDRKGQPRAHIGPFLCARTSRPRRRLLLLLFVPRVARVMLSVTRAFRSAVRL